MLVLHHTGKKSDREDSYIARGASALSDAARVVLLLKSADPKECKGAANIDDHEIATGRVLRLLNPKLSYGPRQGETWLRRTDGGVLDRFVPKFRRPDVDAEAMNALRAWAAGRDKPVYERTIKEKYTDIFEGLSRRAAVQVFKRAIETRVLIASIGGGYVPSKEDEQ